MPWTGYPSVKRYGFAVGVVTLCAMASVSLGTRMGLEAPLIVFFPGVILALFLGGLGPGILATALSAVFGVILAIWPDGRLETAEILQLVVFTLTSALSCRMMAAGEKHAQEEIDVLGTAMAGAAEGVVRLTEDAVLVSFNASFATTVAQPDEALTQHSFLEVVHAADRMLVTDALRESRKAGRAEAEVRLLGRDPAPVDVHLMFVRLSTLDGSSRGHYCFIRDISGRKKEEAQLKEKQDRFQRAFHLSHAGMAIVSPLGQILEVNQALCIITGYTQGELTARDFQSVTHPDDIKADQELLRRLRAGEINDYRRNKRYIGRRGEAIPVAVSVTMVRDNRARPLYYIAQVQEMAAPGAPTNTPEDAPAPPATGA